MEENQSNWQRIDAVIKWANMSTNYFARHIGLARGENLYQIKRGNNGISLDVADRIVTKFPQIDKLWLLTGEGQMFSDVKMRGAQIPFFRLDPEQNLNQAKRTEPEAYLMLPMVDRCDFAMSSSGRAMGSVIPPETTVLFKAVSVESIIPGEIYLVVTNKFTALRFVRTGEKKNEIRLVPGDRENYDDLVINKSEINTVYKLVGKIIINN